VILDDETDLLAARFREYEDIPEVTHVIAEAPVTYDGKVKPLHFWENRFGRFGGYGGKWNHVRVEAAELPADAPPKARKNALRDYLPWGLHGDPEDIILHGNIDEIPSPWFIRELLNGNITLPVATDMRWCAYRADRIHPARWRGTAAHHLRQAGSFSGVMAGRRSLSMIVEAGTRLASMGMPQPDEEWRHPDGRVLWQAAPDKTWPRWIAERSCPAQWLE
jgi:hypothetical protein